MVVLCLSVSLEIQLPSNRWLGVPPFSAFKKHEMGRKKMPSGMEMIGSSFWNHAYADRLQMFYLHFIIGRHVSIFGGGSIDILKLP